MSRQRKLTPKDPSLMSQFEKLCAMHCTEEEIAAFLEVDDNTMRYWCYLTYGESSFSKLYKQFSQKGNMSIRRAQMKLAEKSATMAIWLGKVYLDQRDPDKNEEAGVQEIEDWAPLREMLKSDDDSNK